MVCVCVCARVSVMVQVMVRVCDVGVAQHVELSQLTLQATLSAFHPLGPLADFAELALQLRQILQSHLPRPLVLLAPLPGVPAGPQPSSTPATDSLFFLHVQPAEAALQVI